ncbi:flagellin [Fulvimarina sp. MAC8]|uniref:flagellin N-terminal helical domain-containing protein n=1 Tax=Fulvimarina sp. MAC8 TaxID=3162874 RepID=UPI0032F02DB6
MTSINTNVAAMTALQNLQSTNTMMDQTQNRISTGYRVAEASDNAAYWSIATTMRSDNKAMSAVTDALGIGAATVDTAYTAMTSAKDVLDEIKLKLTAASQDGTDRAKVQGEISQLQSQLKSIAKSASFSGQNWLSVSKTTTASVTSSFSREENGSITLGTIGINTADTALFIGSDKGILGTEKIINKATMGTVAAATPMIFDETGDRVQFTVALAANGSNPAVAAQTIQINAADTDGSIDNTAELAEIIKEKIEANTSLAGRLKVDVDKDGNLVLSSESKITTTAGTGTAGTGGNTTAPVSTAMTAVAAAANTELKTSVANLDISGNTINGADIEKFIDFVDAALENVIAAAADLGSIKTRIDMQTEFTGKLTDAIDRGIGTLVDADMTEESTKLKALQTQQQLGVQALSIANASAQSIMQLFQG